MESILYRLDNERNISNVVLRGATPDTPIEEGPPIHFIVLLDKSGSMASHNRLKNAIKTISCALDLMKERDIFTLVTFESVVERHVFRQPLTPAAKLNLRTFLQNLVPNHNTHLSGALSMIHEIMDTSTSTSTSTSSNSNSSSSSNSTSSSVTTEATVSTATADTHYKTGVFLLTDGEPTAGVCGLPELKEHVRILMERFPDITLTTAGYGEEHNATLLQELASLGNGSYNIVNNLEQVATVFGDVLGGLKTCIVQQMRILVPLSVRQLTKFTERVVGDQKEIIVGDIISGGEITIVLEDLNGPVVLKGADVITGIPLVETLDYSPLLPEYQIAGTTVFLRCQLADLVDRTNRLLWHHGPSAETLAFGEALLAKLRLQPSSSMIIFLIEECERTLRIMRIPPPPMLSRTVSNQLSQHSNALGTGRGVMSSDVDDPAGGAGMFSSPTQVQGSVNMRIASTNPDVPNPHNPDTPHPSAGFYNLSTASNPFPQPPNSPTLRRS
jgi:uncharacterized protein YegL